MNWLVDLIILGVFILTIIIYAIRGLVSSVWGAVRSICAVGASFLFGPICGTLLFNIYFQEKMNKENLARLLSGILGYVLVFIAAQILLMIIGILVKKFAELPVINTVNHLLGAILGVVAGFIYVWVLCWFVSFLVERNLAGQATESMRVLAEQSILFRFFCHISPMDYINITDIKSLIDEIIRK